VSERTGELRASERMRKPRASKRASEIENEIASKRASDIGCVLIFTTSIENL